ncbi:hypothetical protein GKC56_02960 [Neisseriaceae bacterium PsAf]|nr:hypothetical protein [Neisseriaceae bacterium PsAf]
MESSIQEIEKALTYVDSQERDIWVKIGAALKTELGEDGFFLFDRWSQGATNYNARDVKTNWKSFKAGRINIGTLFHYAKQGGYQPQKNPSFIRNSIRNLARKNLENQKVIEAQQRQQAKQKSQRIWNSAQPVSKHNYLDKKLIQNPQILRQLRQTTINGANLLFVPIQDINGEIQSLQYINEDGTKRFTANGETKGNFLLLGDAEQAKQELILAEGLATASSIFEATGKPVLVTFNAGNMVAVAEKLAQHDYSKNYILAIDNDSSATGLNKALQAQKFLPEAQIIAPSFTKADVAKFQEEFGQLPSDFNDKHLLSGIDSIQHQFHIPMNQEQSIPQPQYSVENSYDSPVNIESQEQIEEYHSMMYSESLETEVSGIEIEPSVEPDELQNSIEVAEPEIEQSQAYIEEITPEKIPPRAKLDFGVQISTSPSKAGRELQKEIAQPTPEEAMKPKIILNLDYEVPASLKKIYLIENGKFFDDKYNLQFKDFGNQLKTQKTDEQTVRNMIDIAQAKNWQSIKVKGSREFKLKAWIIASERGIEISVFKPNAQELAQLDKFTQSFTNSISDNKSKELNQNQSVNNAKTPDNLEKTQQPLAQTPELFKVVDFGEAHYAFDEKNDLNFYLKLEKNGQQQTLWGKEIPDALAKENIQKGDFIVSAERTGKEAVKVKTNEYDEQGNFIGQKEIETYKNIWKITKPEQVLEQPIENSEHKENIKANKEVEPIKEAESMATETVQAEPEVVNKTIPANLFTVIDFGKDHKNFDPENAKSHFLQYQDQEGNNYYLWDKKIPEYLHTSKIKVGDLIYEPKITKITEKNFMNEKNEVVQYQEKSYRIDKYTEPKIQKQDAIYKVIEFGNGIDKNGEKNFFLKLEQGGEQKILWGEDLKEQIKTHQISAGDQLAKVNLVNGKFEIQPLVISQSKNQSKLVGQMEERAENEITEQSNHSAKEKEREKPQTVTEQMLSNARDNYQLVSKQLSKNDQVKLKFYENEIKKVIESLTPEEQQKALYTYYEKAGKDFIRGAKLEIPRQFLMPQTAQEVTKTIETSKEISY